MEVHPEHREYHRDEYMLEQGSDTKYISAPPRSSPNVGENSRVLAQYEEGNWKVEAQVQIDGEWYIARRNKLQNPPKDAKEYTVLGNPVKQNYGAFRGLSTPMRLLFAPIYAAWFAYLCVKGEDVNLQLLE